MTGLRSARLLMLDFAKLVHEAIGIESPRAFITVFALVGLLFFGGIGWLVDKGYRTKLEETERATKQQVSTPDTKKIERIFLPPDVDYRYLADLYREHTSIQADQLAARYIGKWMRLTVVIDNVAHYGGGDYYSIISFLNERPTIVGEMEFDANWGDRVAILRRGSTVTVIGILSRVSSSGLNLKNCELLP